MTIYKAIKILQNDLYTKIDKHSSDEKEAVEVAISALSTLEQVKWERDIALFQLEQLGLGLGQKIDGVYLSKEEYEKLKGD